MPSPHDRDVVLAGPIRSMTAVLGHRAGIAHCLTFNLVQKPAGLAQEGVRPHSGPWLTAGHHVPVSLRIAPEAKAQAESTLAKVPGFARAPPRPCHKHRRSSGTPRRVCPRSLLEAFASLAELAEHLPVARGVVGSSLAGGSIRSTAQRAYVQLCGDLTSSHKPVVCY